jgi:hypothetical protein
MLTLMRSCWFRLSLSKVVAEWLTLLLRTREVTGSNLSPKTGYPDFLHDFLQYLQENDGPYIRPRPLRYTSFLIHHSPITLSFEAIYIILLLTDKASLNKLQITRSNIRFGLLQVKWSGHSFAWMQVTN